MITNGISITELIESIDIRVRDNFFGDALEITDRLSGPQRTEQLEKILAAAIEAGCLDTATETVKRLGRYLTPEEFQRIWKAESAKFQKDHRLEDIAAE